MKCSDRLSALWTKRARKYYSGSSPASPARTALPAAHFDRIPAIPGTGHSAEMNALINSSQIIEDGSSEARPEGLLSPLAIQPSAGIELASLWLAFDAFDHREKPEETVETKRLGGSGANAHLRRLLKHLRFLTQFGAPHLAPLLSVFSAYLDRSIKRNAQRRKMNCGRSLAVRV
jgi:hypothetical protein